MEKTPTTRTVFFDAYRTLLVLAVVSLHGAMTYMAHVPAWWYVINPERDLSFLVWVLVTDTFPMPALFFLSGYFSPLSLERKGRQAFLKDKMFRIGLPWVVGVLLFAPLFARATWKSLSLPLPSYGLFIRNLWLGPAYQQAHFWFLGVLLALFTLAALIGSPVRSSSAGKGSPAGGLFLWWVLSVAGFFCASLKWHPDLWIPLGPLYFQPARIVAYVAAFFLGQRAWRDDWFADSAKGGKVFGVSLLASIGALFFVVFLPLSFPGGDSPWLRMAQAVAYASAALSLGAALLLFCRAFLNRPSPTWRLLGECSYGVYWLHQMILMPLAAWLIPFELPLAAKFSLALVLTCLLGLALTAGVLRRVPLLRRIF